jgi:hypothetical protein
MDRERRELYGEGIRPGGKSRTYQRGAKRK